MLVVHFVFRASLQEIGKHLAEGLAKLSIERPAQPLMWLSNYFRELAESTGETATKDKYAWDEQ